MTGEDAGAVVGNGPLEAEDLTAEPQSRNRLFLFKVKNLYEVKRSASGGLQRGKNSSKDAGSSVRDMDHSPSTRTRP